MRRRRAPKGMKRARTLRVLLPSARARKNELPLTTARLAREAPDSRANASRVQVRIARPNGRGCAPQRARQPKRMRPRSRGRDAPRAVTHSPQDASMKTKAA